MRTLGRIVRLCFVVLVAPLMAVGQAHAGMSCHKINAQGVGQDLGPSGTVARISGGGLLQGTTEGHFVVSGGTFPVFTIVGTVEFTTNKATVIVTVEGTFDVSTGEFSAAGPITASTGKLSGATGVLLLQGVQNLLDGSFVEDVTGSICVELAP